MGKVHVGYSGVWVIEKNKDAFPVKLFFVRNTA